MLLKKVIFLSFYQCFKIFIFTKKKTTKKNEKTFEKDTEITIDNVIFKFFNKKSHFIKKVNFSIDNDLQYFSPKNHFLYWKNGFPKILEVKKKFSQQQ